MDAFYASVEQRDNPALRGLPLAVGHDGPRGVVATASYEARRYGVRSAMAMARARRLCAALVVVPGRMDVYKAVSRDIRRIFDEYTELVEPLSLDEAFLDVTHHPSASLVAQEIKDRIMAATALTASAGVSVNKMLAKIASDYRKPNGMFVVPPQAVEPFVASLGVERFFGIGKVTAQKMHAMGIFTGADLRRCPLSFLTDNFGKAGRDYYLYARGVDERPVIPHRERKSVGAENTFESDTADLTVLRERLAEVRSDVLGRMDRAGFRGRTVTLKVRFGDFTQITRSVTLESVVGERELHCCSERLLAGADIGGRPVRLVGLTVSSPVSDVLEGEQLYLEL